MPAGGTRWERYPLPMYAWRVEVAAYVAVESVQPSPLRLPGHGPVAAGAPGARRSAAHAPAAAMARAAKRNGMDGTPLAPTPATGRVPAPGGSATVRSRRGPA